MAFDDEEKEKEGVELPDETLGGVLEEGEDEEEDLLSGGLVDDEKAWE